MGLDVHNTRMTQLHIHPSEFYLIPTCQILNCCLGSVIGQFKANKLKLNQTEIKSKQDASVIGKKNCDP